jgi:hypothetical protein
MLSILFSGFTTDGEFNSVRTSGKSRPISIVGVIQEARNKARSIGEKKMTSYFKLDGQGKKSMSKLWTMKRLGRKKPRLKLGETIRFLSNRANCGKNQYYNFCNIISCSIFPTGNPLQSHPAVPIEDLLWLRDYMDNGTEKKTFADAIYILRRKLFPFMHNPHQWVEGITNLK